MAAVKTTRQTREQVRALGQLMTEAQSIHDRTAKLLRAMDWPERIVDALRKNNKQFQDLLARGLER